MLWVPQEKVFTVQKPEFRQKGSPNMDSAFENNYNNTPFQFVI